MSSEDATVPTPLLNIFDILNIRFDDGVGRAGGKRRFQVRKSDPFSDDSPPEWLLNGKQVSDQVEAAIYDFVDRHIRKKLMKHADRG